jgi:hypothetical protein
MDRLDPQSHVLYQAGGPTIFGPLTAKRGIKIALQYQKIGIGKLEGRLSWIHRYEK